MGSRVRADGKAMLHGRLYAGIDPSGGRSSWGFAVVSWLPGRCHIIEAWESRPSRVYSSLERLASIPVDAVGVDAPVNVLREAGPWRGCELEALKKGARLLPLNTPGMVRLSRNGLSVFRLFEEAGVPVVETHPTSILSSLDLANTAYRRRHLLDAIISAVAVGAFFEEPASVRAALGDCILIYSVGEHIGRECGLSGKKQVLEETIKKVLKEKRTWQR